MGRWITALLAVASFVLLSSGAYAQALQPITLSPEEFLSLIAALAQQNPVGAALLQKQQQAQKAAAEAGKKTDPGTADLTPPNVTPK